MEKQIISLFLTNKKLRFNEIEKSLNIRSNKLDYHIKKLISKGILQKNKEFYNLSESSESIIPYISSKNSILPVVLICIKNTKKEVFLYKRKKRPYDGLWSLPGGRILLGESVKECVRRIMREKHSLNATLTKINSVSVEHLKRKGKIINSFLLIFASAKVKEKVIFIDIDKNKKHIIESDYNLIKKDSDKAVKINVINSIIK